MQTVFMMRYSYFGLSGWRSDTSRDIDALLNPERLTQRYRLLRDIALPSLAAQNDPNFKLVVLSSKAMPDWRKRQLRDVCHEHLGKDRVRILWRPPGRATRFFRKYLNTHCIAEPMTTQVVLDDDDAVSNDFVGMVKREAKAAYELREPGYDFMFLSFPKGFSLQLGDGKARLFHRSMPFTNLGLSLVGPSDIKKTVYGIAHKNVAHSNPARAIYTQSPYYIRTVHDSNDSNAVLGEKEVDAELMPDVLARFPCLHQYFPDIPLANPETRLSA